MRAYFCSLSRPPTLRSSPLNLLARCSIASNESHRIERTSSLAFVRAFAAEFLLPSEALHGDARSLDSFALPENFEQVLDRFGVGATTAAYHLWNRRLLSSSDVRDHLIDRFSSVGR